MRGTSVSGRTLLGAADVPDDRFRAIVAAAVGARPDDVDVLTSHAEVSPYDIDALTTAGRYRVRGRARRAGVVVDYSVFVKVVRSWRHHPAFAFVPEGMRAAALAGLPFDAEPRVYRSDLADRLPPGLAMPRAYAVIDLDADTTALWLEDVPVETVVWDTARLAHAARLLGALGASPRVAEVAAVADPTGAPRVRLYAEGRLAAQVVPALHDDDLWHHPLLAEGFGSGLRARLVDAAARLPEVVDELETLPAGTAHGDATTRNLLVRAGRDEIVLIDFGFWTPAPLGFDLGQLVGGEVQLGERPAAGLAADSRTCLAAYLEGARSQGSGVEQGSVRRCHALQMLLFSALPALPFELLDGEPTPARLGVARERAALARHVLDLVDRTG